MSVNFSGAKFSKSTPGQDLDEVASRLSVDDLRTILGQDILDLIQALDDVSDKLAMLRRLGGTFLWERAEEMLARRDVREICLNAMSPQKIKDLAERIGKEDINAVWNSDIVSEPQLWRSFLGFFDGGISRKTSPFAVASDNEIVQPKFGLFPHQRRVADKVRDAIRGGYGRVVMHMPTGAGKTRTAMDIVSRILVESEPCVVVWLANSVELLEQAADAFQHAWARLGNRDICLVRFWGNHMPKLAVVSDGLVVAGLQKIHALKVRDRIDLLRLGKSVKLVVVDEAHQAIAPTYSELINLLVDTGKYNALLGLTATPGRTWSDIEADARLSQFFGNRKVMLEIEGWDDPVSFLMKESYLAYPTFRRLEVEAEPMLQSHLRASRVKDEYDPELLDVLAKQIGRNILIIDEAKRLIRAGHNRIILFGASVRHAEVLAAAFSALEIDAHIVTGKTVSTKRKKLINKFRKTSSKPMILCNFGVLTTGFDAPNTSAAIIARPTKSLVLFSQMAGRAMRGCKAGGNRTCEISTVVDIDLPGFRDVAEAFTNWEDVWHDSN